MIRIENLSKAYGPVRALSDISLSVGAGEIIGLLGPNGAGKTTLMKVMTGYLQPDSGSAVIDGLNVLENPMEVQALIGYLPENAPLYPELTVQGCLQLAADLRGMDGSNRIECISEAVYSTGLAEKLTTPIGELSKGFRQRVGLAQAILHRPKLLILDEPTNGLDPTQILEVRHLIRRLSGRSTVVLSTHILSEVEATCDRAVIIMNGRIKTDARMSELAGSTGALMTLKDPPGDAEEKIRALAGTASVKVSHGQGRVSFHVKGEAGRDMCPALYAAARDGDWNMVELRTEVRTLESVFNELAMAEGGVTV